MLILVSGSRLKNSANGPVKFVQKIHGIILEVFPHSATVRAVKR